jgi:F-type H+-transporting ATPase subunit epsilon
VAKTKFPVEVLTPEGEVYNGDVEMVSTRTGTGSIGIQAGHIPLLAMLDPTELRLYESETEIVRFAQGEGYAQVADGRVLVLVEEATRPEDLDVGELREKLSEAESGLADCEPDSEEQRRLLRDKARWEMFIAIAEGGGPGH